MDFTWKAAKRTSNLKKHGFDFADAKQVFNGPTSTEEDARDYDGDGRANRIHAAARDPRGTASGMMC